MRSIAIHCCSNMTTLGGTNNLFCFDLPGNKLLLNGIVSAMAILQQPTVIG